MRVVTCVVLLVLSGCIFDGEEAENDENQDVESDTESNDQLSKMSVDLIFQKRKLYKLLKEVVPKYYNAIGADAEKITPSLFAAIEESRVVLKKGWKHKRAFEGLLSVVVLEVERRVRFYNRKPSNVLFQSLHAMMMIFRLLPREEGRFDAIVVLTGIQRLLVEQVRTKPAVEFYLLYLGLADLLQETGTSRDGKTAAITFVEEYALPLRVASSDELKGRWTDVNQRKKYPLCLIKVETFISKGNEVTKSPESLPILAKFFSMAKNMWDIPFSLQDKTGWKQRREAVESIASMLPN